LEVQFCVKLIDGKKKRVCLTKAGEMLLSYAEELFNKAIVTEDFLKNYRFSNLCLGISAPLMPYLSDVVAGFNGLRPSVRVSIREDTSRTLVQELLDFKFDMFVVGSVPANSESLSIYRIPRDEEIARSILCPRTRCEARPVGFLSSDYSVRRHGRTGRGAPPVQEAGAQAHDPARSEQHRTG
jgi:DNA-binding transcriptional LysR family regulator